MKQPILQSRNDGRTVFVTKYRHQGDALVSAGERYEFDVTRGISQIKADTIQGLTEALIDKAYGSGEPNVAAWISTKRHLAAEHQQQPLDATATVGGRPQRARPVEPMLEPQGEGWMLRLQHRDQASGYVPSRQPGGYTHPVTQQIGEMRAALIDQHLTTLAQAAWSEKRPDAMAFVKALAVGHREDRTAAYGLNFAIENAPSAPSMMPGGPRLRAIPGGRA